MLRVKKAQLTRTEQEPKTRGPDKKRASKPSQVQIALTPAKTVTKVHIDVDSPSIPVIGKRSKKSSQSGSRRYLKVIANKTIVATNAYTGKKVTLAGLKRRLEHAMVILTPSLPNVLHTDLKD